MAVEIEKKYRLPPDRIDAIRNQLTRAGAQSRGETFEENIVYGGDILAQKGAIIRIRKTPDKNLLTFKRRLPSAFDVKEQIEYECEISDAEAIADLLGELGLQPAIVYEKRRESWSFRNVEIVVDRLPFGSFMEIEGLVTAIKEAEMLLDLEDLVTELATYPQLSLQFGKKVSGIVEARFRVE